MTGWKTLDSRLLLDRTPRLRVYDENVALPDGRVVDGWTRVWLPDFVVIAAVTGDGKMLAIRSYRHGPRTVELGLPGGIVDPGEDRLAAAVRELREETGYAADDWSELGTFVNEPNRDCGNGTYYLARGAHRVAEPDAGDLEEIDVELRPVPAMLAAVASGEVGTVQNAAAIALAAATLRN